MSGQKQASAAPAAVDQNTTAVDQIENLGTTFNDAWLWVINHWEAAATMAALVVGLYAVLEAARVWVVGHARRHAGEPVTLTQIVSRVVARTKSWVLAIVAVRIVAGFITPPASIMGVINFLFVLAVVVQVAIWVREAVMGLIERRVADGDNETLVNASGVIRLLISAVIFIIAGIVVLDNLGVNVTGLIAGLGIGGIAIGLAAQGIFSDLFSALSIIFDRPFRRGETIKYDQTTATVERIGLKSTRLRSVNGELLIISNTNLLSKEIANFARLHRRRVRYTLGLVYQTPVEKLRALPGLLEQTIGRCSDVEFVRAHLELFGPSSLDFTLLFDVLSDDPNVLSHRQTDVGLAVVELLNREGYELAYPTQTTFTAAPDGKLIMPFAEAKVPSPA